MAKHYVFLPSDLMLCLLATTCALFSLSENVQATCVTDVAELIDAIHRANTNNMDDVIELCDSNIVLGSVQDTIKGSNGLSLTIENGTIERDAANAPPFRIFNVDTDARLKLNNVGLLFGHILDGTEDGGAIYNLGTLSLTDCSFSNNAAFGS